MCELRALNFRFSKLRLLLADSVSNSMALLSALVNGLVTAEERTLIVELETRLGDLKLTEEDHGASMVAGAEGNENPYPRRRFDLKYIYSYTRANCCSVFNKSRRFIAHNTYLNIF